MAKQNFYTYPSMEKQLKQWTVQYSADYFRLDSIGRTPTKRHLYACHLGAADAPKQLVLTASIHGREYINTTLLLDMLAYYLPRYNHRELPDAPCYRELWRDVCIIFLPMITGRRFDQSEYSCQKMEGKQRRCGSEPQFSLWFRSLQRYQ